jgi:large repetitive protein
MTLQVNRTRIACAMLLCAAIPGMIAAAPVTATFSNTSPITINHTGPATPSASTISVSGLRGDASQVVVTLSGVSHSYPDDIEVLLLAPTGQKIKLMSDAGGSADLNGVSLSFSADALSHLPESSIIYPGTYLPTDTSENDFLPTASSAPVPPYTLDMSSLSGPSSALNGTWMLYVADDQPGDGGTIAGGWTLSITTGGGFDGCAAEGYSGSQYALCRQICEADRSGANANSFNGLLNAWTRQFQTAPRCRD